MAQYIYGRNTVLSALKSGRVVKLFLLSNFEYTPIIDFIHSNNVPFKKVEQQYLDSLVKGLQQGVVAEIKPYEYLDLDGLIKKSMKKKNPLLVMLDEINDPHNLGAILRSCDAFGVDGVIMKKTGQVPLNATVAKVSTGAIDYVPVTIVSNLNNAVDKLKKSGYWIVASDGKAKNDYREIDYNVPIVLIVGSEGFGVSQLLCKNSDFLIKIPMVGTVNSFNASVATAVLLAQIYNNRNPL